MFLHIGGNYLIRHSDVIGIFNVSSLQEDPKGRKFLAEVKQNERLMDISEGKWSSVVLTNDKIYVTRISSATLLGRSREDVTDLLSVMRSPDDAVEEEAVIDSAPEEALPVEDDDDLD